MRKLSTLLLFLLIGAGIAFGQGVPELLYYKFDGTGTSVPNEASSPPTGTATATIQGNQSQGSSGLCGGALVGSGGSSTSDYLNTGWTTSYSGSWTISFWTSNIPPSTTLFYIFGDNTAGSFRCFTNGVAGANNWMLRGPLTDVLVSGAATTAANVTTFVYDAPAGVVRAYLNGTLVNTVAQGTITLNGTGPFKVGGYASNTGLPSGGLMDEFRFYNRALDSVEIQQVYNQCLPLSSSPNDAGVRSIDGPSAFCPDSQDVVVTIRNYGTAILDSCKVNWSINGVTQPVYNFVGPLDTLGGTGSNTAQITLGRRFFAANTPYNLTVFTSLPNGAADTVNYNDTLRTTVQASISGTFTINSGNPTGGTNFNSFSDAASALNAYGICGPVVFNVTAGSGPYNEKLSLGSITGASPTNTITFNGGASKEKIAYSGTTTTDWATVRLDGAKHVFLKNLTIENTGTTYAMGVRLVNQADSNTIDSCVILLDSTATSTLSTGISAASSTSSTGTGTTSAQNITISNNRIVGGGLGIALSYQSSTVHGVNNQVINNQLHKIGTYGMYLYYQDNLTIQGNEIRMNNTGATHYGLYMVDDDIFNVIGNKIIDYGYVGIYMSSVNFGSGAPSRIINNMISGQYQFTSTSNGSIYLVGSSENLNIWHNSFSSHGGASAVQRNMRITLGTTSSGIDIRNNSFAVYTGGTALHVTNPSVISGLDYNNYYTTDTNAVVILGSTTLTPGTITGAGANSHFGDPIYLDNVTDLHTKFTQLNDRGDNNVGVGIDIDGETRPASGSTIVDIGADEYTPPQNDAGITRLLQPTLPICAGSTAVEVTILNYGLDTLNTLTVSWTVNGVAQTGANLTNLGLLTGDTIAVNLGTINILGNQTYDLVIYTSNPNGSSDEDNANDTLKFIGLRTGLTAGTYTIDAGSPPSANNYQSFADAVADLNTFGVCGPVVFNVVAGSGPYNEQVVLQEVQGTSLTNTITFNGGATKETVYVNTSSVAVRGVFNLLGADYVTIKNLTLINYDPTTAAGVLLRDRADYNTIDSCVIIVDTSLVSTSGGLAGIVASSPTSGTSSIGYSETANNMTVTNNVIRGGYYGLVMTYQGTTNYGSGNVVRFNRFEDVYYMGIYSYYQSAPLVTNNELLFRPYASPMSTLGYGIYVIYAEAPKIIANNIVRPRYMGIYLSNANYYGGTPSARGQIINNMICGETPYTSPYGIYVTTNSNDMDIFHNSIALTNGTARCLYVASTNVSGLDIRNNAFGNFNNTGGNAVYLVSASNASQFNYNCFYNNGFNDLVYIAGTSYDSSNFRGASGFNQASFAANPGFTDIFSDLHAGASGAVLWDRGNNAAGVSDDIDGDTRPGFSTFIVDVGADEFEPPAIQGTLVAFTSPTSGCGLSDSTVVGMRFRNSGLDTLYSVGFTYVLNGGTPVNETYNDTILPGQAFTYLFNNTANMQNITTYTLDGWIAVTGDTLNFDDSVLNYTVVNVPTVSTYPYLENFENGAGGWIAEGSAEWELGQPSNTIIDTAFSGVNAWVTDLDNTYENGACGYVISPCFDFSNLGLPEVSLAVWWNSEFSWDGMVLQSTTDNGATWVNVGAVGDPNNWYNDNSIAGLGVSYCALGTNEDGWAGRNSSGNGSGGWLIASHEVPQLAGEPGVRFRLYFGSDGSVQDEGVAFDDFAIRDLPPNDVGAQAMVDPQGGNCGDSIAPVSVQITNYGSQPQTNFLVSVAVDSNGVSLGTLSATYTDTLAVKGIDTVTVGVTNTYRGGDFTFTAYTSLAGDSDVSNDTIVEGPRRIVGVPYAPVAFGDTSCQADSFLLTVQVDSGFTYVWYDSAVGGNRILEGDSLQTPFLTSSATYYVAATAFSADTITTPFNGNNGQSGNMFDVFAKKTLVVDSFDVAIDNTASQIVEIYYTTTASTYQGNETNAAAWTLLGRDTVLGQGFTNANGQTTRVSVGGLVIPGGTSKGIYVTLVTTTNIDYVTLSTPDTIENTDIAIFRGVGKSYPFGSTFNPRGWLGRVYYSSPGCEGDRAAVHAVISSPPPVDLGPDVVTCGDVVLDAGANWATYSWSTGATSQTITVNQTGTYSVTITNQDGCIGADTINVITNPNPPVDLGADTTTCGAYLLDAGNPGATWTWQDGSNSQTYLATSSGLYYVSVVNAFGCQTIDSVNLVINAIPPVDLGPDATVCDSAVLDAGNPGLPTLWSTGATSQTITVKTSGQYFVEVTDPATGCAGQDTINLGVAPSPMVDLGADTTICDGDVLLLDAGNPGSSYAWSTGVTTQTAVVNTSGSFSVVVTDVNGCDGSDTISVDVAPPAIADFNVQQVAFTYTFNFSNLSSGSGVLSYLWDFGDNNTSTQENPSHTYAVDGNYIVCLEVTDDCGTEEFCDTITVSLTNAIDDGLLAGSVRLFPNPTDGKVFVTISDFDADVEVAITDMTGRTIAARTIMRFEQDQAIEFDLTEEAEGVYLVRFEAEGRRLLRKVVLER